MRKESAMSVSISSVLYIYASISPADSLKRSMSLGIRPVDGARSDCAVTVCFKGVGKWCVGMTGRL